MAQNQDDGRDEIDDISSSPSLEEILDVAERTGGLNSFLDVMSQKGGKWNKSANTASDAVAASESSSDEQAGTDSKGQPNVPGVTVPSTPPATALEIAQITAGKRAIENVVKNHNIQTVLNDPTYIANGASKPSPDGEIPHAEVICEIPAPPTQASEELGVVIETHKLYEHPIIGVHVEPQSEYLKNDPELLQVHRNTLNQGIHEMGPVGSIEAAKKIVDIMNANARQVVIKNIETFSFLSALEYHLQHMNKKDRAVVFEHQQSRKATGPKRERKTVSTSTTPKGAVSFQHSNPKKAATIIALKKQKNTKEEIIEILTDSPRGCSDEDRRYLDELFA